MNQIKQTPVASLDAKPVAINANIKRLTQLEAEMIKFPQVEPEVVHHFAPGLYAREMHVPAGVLLTGKIHRHAHLNVMSAGSAVLVNESGRQVVTAPYSFVSAPGTKRAFYAIEDMVWTTFHPTDETDLDKIEAEWIVEDPRELEVQA